MGEKAGRFFVLTGGPGWGKSSLIDALQCAVARSIEAGRGIIQDQEAIGGRALPWTDPILFAELMLSGEMRSYPRASEHMGPVFFDRGVSDVVGYLRLLKLPVPDNIEKAAETIRYNRRGFIAPPIQEIFSRIANANKGSTRHCGHMRRWRQSTLPLAVSSSNFRRLRSRNGSVLFFKIAVSPRLLERGAFSAFVPY